MDPISHWRVMQPSPAIQHKPIRTVAIVFAAAGLGPFLSAVFSFIACSGGFLFSGLSAGFVTFVAAGVCAVISPLAAVFLNRRQRHFGWRTLLMVVSVCALIAVGVLSYLDTRQHMRIFMSSSPVPSGLRIHHGRKFLFGSYVHFTGPPATIASLLQSKRLLEVPAEPPESGDYNALGCRKESKASWGWWQPTSMPSPRFYFLHHESLEVQGWIEGWWVSGATNEVYAFISG